MEVFESNYCQERVVEHLLVHVADAPQDGPVDDGKRDALAVVEEVADDDFAVGGLDYDFLVVDTSQVFEVLAVEFLEFDSLVDG